MNAHDILTRTFAEHEDLAPTADTVLSAVRSQLEGDRRRRTTQALSTLAAAAAIAAVAIGIAVVSGDGGHTDSPAAGSGTPSPSSVSTSFGRTVAAPLFVTIAPGWLPGSAVQQVAASTGLMSQARDYLVTDGHANLDLELRLGREDTFPNRQRGVPATHTTVNGRRAVQFAKPGYYEAIFTSGDGRLAAVSLAPHLPYSTEEYSATAMSRIGRHIARTMRFDVQEVVPVAAKLTYLPDGVVVQRVDTADNGLGYTNYVLRGPSGKSDAIVDIGGTRGNVGSGAGTPGRAVQGHRTEELRQAGGYQLRVFDLRRGHSVALTTGDGVSTLGELYKIADGIRFSG